MSSFLSSENRSTLSSLANSTSSFQEPLVASGRSALRSGLRSAARKQISSLGCSTPVTPRILVSKCEKLEKLVEEKEVKTKKILRGKIKSPANKINKSIAERNLRNKERIESYETQLKKKESEILSLTRKVNLLQKTVSEREKTIKGLEIKFPKMISELKHGLLEEKKTNVELKDVLKKFRQANGNKKQMEEKLKQKDEKLKEIKLSKRKLTMELQSKESELSDFRIRIRSLEGKIPQLVDEIESKEDELRQQVAEISERDEDLARSEETVEFLEQRLAAQSEEQKNQEKLIDDLKRKLNEYTDELDAKEIEIHDLRASNVELYNELQEQYEVLEKTDQETQNYLQIIEGIREKIDSAPMEKIHNSIEYLDKATDDFLEKVSSVSKRKNMSFGVKLTVRKGSVPAGRDQLERLESFVLNPSSFNNNSTRFSFNNVKHSSINSGRFSQDFRLSQSRNSSIHHPSRGSLDEPRRNLQFKFMNSTTDSFDDVFQDERGRRVSTAESSRITETSRSDVDISSDTCTRLEVNTNNIIFISIRERTELRMTRIRIRGQYLLVRLRAGVNFWIFNVLVFVRSRSKDHSVRFLISISANIERTNT